MSVPYDVWADDAAETSAATATDTENTQDEQPTENTAGEGAPVEDELDPALVARIQKELEKREQELVDAIENGDATSKVYKGLQKRLNERNQEVQNLMAQLDETRAQLQELGLTTSGIYQGVQWLTDTTLSALDDDGKRSAEEALTKLRMSMMEKELKDALDRSKVQEPATPPAEDPQQAAYEEALTTARQRFVDGRRESAQAFGVDPDDTGLDYGGDEEPFLDRLRKFEVSLKKVIDGRVETELEEVREKVPVTPTRTTGGGTLTSGGHGLESAAAKLLAEINRGKFS